MRAGTWPIMVCARPLLAISMVSSVTVSILTLLIDCVRLRLVLRLRLHIVSLLPTEAFAERPRLDIIHQRAHLLHCPSHSPATSCEFVRACSPVHKVLKRSGRLARRSRCQTCACHLNGLPEHGCIRSTSRPLSTLNPPQSCMSREEAPTKARNWPSTNLQEWERVSHWDKSRLSRENAVSQDAPGAKTSDLLKPRSCHAGRSSSPPGNCRKSCGTATPGLLPTFVMRTTSSQPEESRGAQSDTTATLKSV